MTIVLICGKIGEGKTTAINAFFNIIKGITLEDNYRFILIHEPKGKKESENDGVHLYYVKDYNNKQLVIIDSHGYEMIYVGGNTMKKYIMLLLMFFHLFLSLKIHSF